MNEGNDQERPVRSGEHLAAIFLCGVFGCMPSAFDQDGGLDLVFDEVPARSSLPLVGPAAFEVKSLPGAFRKELDLLQRGKESGRPLALRPWIAAEVMDDAQPTLLKAERSLKKKTSPGCSRNVFLVTHQFDHFAVDIAQSQIVGHLMPEKMGYEALDSIWVYWPPDKLVVWSKLTQAWADIIFVIHPEAPLADERLSFIQNVELSYIFAAGSNESPYVYNFRFE